MTRQRPPLLTLLALAANLGGVAYITGAVVLWRNSPVLDQQASLLLWSLGAFGVLEVLASFGLLRLDSSGRTLQLIVSFLALVGCCIAAVMWWKDPRIAWLTLTAVPGAILALASLAYLSTADVAAAFDDTDQASSSPVLAIVDAIALALVLLTHLPSPAPKDPAALFKQATSLYWANDYKGAIPLFERYLHQRPNDALAYARLGLSYANSGRFADSIAPLKRAIALDKTDFQSRSNLGLVYQRLGKPELGIDAARESVALQPADARVQNNCGLVLLGAHRPAEAAARFADAVRLAPKDQDYRNNLARANEEAKGKW
jgi:tetratricopeptide (TPR) repeat protein